MKLRHIFENKMNAGDAFYYARDKGKRIPELEPLILKSPYYARNYAELVIKNRWPELEDILKTENINEWELYLQSFPEAEQPSKDDPLLIQKFIILDLPNTITDEQLAKVIELKFSDKINCNGERLLTHIKNLRKRSSEKIKQSLKSEHTKQINLLTAPLTDQCLFLKHLGIFKWYHLTDFE